MSENSSSQPVVDKASEIRWGWLLLLPIWTYAAFWLAQIAVVLVQFPLVWLGVSFDSINEVLFTTTASAVIYILAVIIVAGLPYLIWKRRTTKQEMGASDWPVWMDIFLTAPAYVVYVIASAVLLALIMIVVPDINVGQEQSLPFTQSMLGAGWQYMLAFMTLVVFAPLAEELLFRGYLYGKLRKAAPVWLAVIVASLAFGVAHLWGGPGSPLQWAVMIDTVALGVILSLLREYTGAVWAGVFVHALKNGIAFYLLFINPDVINQLRQSAMVLFI